MLTPICLKCKNEILREDVNVAQDVAYCRPCNLSYKLSDLTHGTEVDPDVDLHKPPAGAWCRKDGLELVIGATHRSIGGMFGTLFFCLFWNGIVSVFVLLAVSATLHLLGVGLPEWFPAPKMNGSEMGVGMTIFLWIFLTPFIVIGLAMFGAFLSFLGGRSEVRIRNSQAVLFTGIGPLGYRRRFNPTTVTAVSIEVKRWRDSDGAAQNKTHIVIELQDGKKLKFGSSLTEERQRFLAGAIRKAFKL